MNDQQDDFFTIINPTVAPIPIIISVPHAGTHMPETEFPLQAEIKQQLPDTDWFVDKLYDFAPAMGITLIRANYSRFYIDLNRDPKNVPLYDDDRFQSTLVATHTFAKKAIYQNQLPTQAEIARRLDHYFWPYYHQIKSLIEKRQQTFKHVLLFDAHSIKRFVPSISAEKFPSLILGNNHLQTADKRLIDIALTALLLDENIDVSHNKPFSGGHISRYFGQPHQHIHALQLEMAQDLYMNEDLIHYDEVKAEAIRHVLKNLFLKLHDALISSEVLS